MTASVTVTASRERRTEGGGERREERGEGRENRGEREHRAEREERVRLPSEMVDALAARKCLGSVSEVSRLPSEMVDALAAVTVPSFFLKAGLAADAGRGSGAHSSSAVTITSPLRDLTVTGAISSPKEAVPGGEGRLLV